MKTNLINGLGVCLSLGLATWGAAQPSRTSSNQANIVTVESQSVPQAPNQTIAQDVRGNRVSIKDYQRIVSVNTVADHLLLKLIEPQRLVGITHHSLKATQKVGDLENAPAYNAPQMSNTSWHYNPTS